MPFKFRLEKVLTLRKEAVEAAHLTVIKAQKALQVTKDKIVKTAAELMQRNEDLIRNNYERAQDHMRVIKQVSDKLDALKKELIRREQELAQAKLDLLEAQKKLEALEKLKEKQAEEYLLEENRLEQIQTDEKATLKYTTELLQQQRIANDEED